jgi:hypothetical protein
LDAPLQCRGVSLRSRFGKPTALLPERGKRLVKLAVATDTIERKRLPIECVRGIS